MNPIDNVERRESDPHAHTRLVAPDHDTQELYEQCLIAVCHALRNTPSALVDTQFVVQVLNCLAGRIWQNSPTAAEALDILADQINDL